MNTDKGDTPKTPRGADNDVGTSRRVGTNFGQLVQASTLIGDIHLHGDDQDPWADVALLARETDANLRLMERNLRLPGAGGGATVDRALFPTLVHEAGDFLLTGEPGTGKTGLMYQLARHHRESGSDVVLLEATRFAEDVNNHLSGSLHDALEQWPGTEPGYLLIDAVDGDRGDALRWLADTVELLRGSRWRTVVSARFFDIAHNRRWHEAFRGAPVVAEPVHRAAELSAVRHFLVGDFTPEELTRAGVLLPALERVLAEGDEELRVLLANPFNLFLACELLQSGDWTEPPGERLDRSSLLRRYWSSYVTDRNGRARNRLLGELCRMMLDRHRLQVSGEHLTADQDGALRDLTANGVLRQIRSSYADAEPSVVFGHHIFFDYAVAQRIFVHEGSSALVARLDSQPNLVFAARPGIDLHLEETWRCDPTRARFASLCWKLAGSDHVLAGLAAASVVVDQARTVHDVDWLSGALAATKEDTAEGVVSWVIGLLEVREERGTEVRRSVVRVWAPIATALATRMRSGFRESTADLLHQVLNRLNALDPLRPGAEGDQERAGCVADLVSSALEDTRERAGVAAAACVHLPSAVNVDARHGDLIRRLMNDEHTRARNPEVFRRCVMGAVEIAEASPRLAGDLLETVWERASDGQGKSDFRAGFTGVHYQVGQVFPDLLPLIGAETACRVLGSATREPYFAEATKQWRHPLSVPGEVGYVVRCIAPLRQAGGNSGAPTVMLDALLHWAGRTGTAGVSGTVRALVRFVRHPGVWERVMDHARSGGSVWRSDAIDLLSSGGLFADTVTRRSAAHLLGALRPHLSDEEHERLEQAVLDSAEMVSAGDGSPDPWTLEELVSYLDGGRLTRPLLIEHHERVERMPVPPDVSFGGIVSGSRAPTPEERYGDRTCAQLGEEGLALVVRLDDLNSSLKQGSDPRKWEELTVLFLEALRCRALMERVVPGEEGSVAAVIAGSARTLARAGDVAPDSELGQRVYQLLRLVVGRGPEAEGERS